MSNFWGLLKQKLTVSASSFFYCQLIPASSLIYSDFYFIRSYSSSSAPADVVPEQYYLNADTDKVTILSDNKGKSGVYRWKNTINGKSYIGSAIDISNRLSNYYSTTYMEDALTRSNSHIYRALLKNGYSNFELTILEYCEPEKL